MLEITDAHKSALNDLSRQQIVKILENHGYQCYDHETDDELRECILEDLKNGNIDELELFAF